MSGIISYLKENKTVLLQQQAASWQDAVKLGTDMLVEKGDIEPSYFESIIEKSREMGLYFILGPGMAMPHARPEDGVNSNSFALVTLKDPINFGDADNDPIDLLVTFAVKDAKFQNEVAIVQIVTLLDEEDLVERLRKATKWSDIESILNDLEGLIENE
ncbi:PTS sugar transporter subunit IIA [Lentisphaerota bacterium ZTH]|nr:PTS sugar transporter subunit IIA [Lentisphaerota bacterium]WET05352.1 PTS sugar transporter subunit IIA [Lentisphaerota bacterium ZTH]